ncbi:hypothetical protein GGI07_001151 [Coemansia sp. Benny D115]|nr:hypothetical protein GGI07_001151 [Coemansia sp. Benny D115]
MLTLNVELDSSSTRCLVYKHRESGLRGKLHIKTSDRLKLRQISIRLVTTELVDLHDSEASNSLHPLLRKSSRTVGTWIIWKRGDPASSALHDGSRHAQGVLDPGDHHYSFEIPLPKGLDGSIESRVYNLKYDLETRLEHSFKLKPDSALLTPVELVQVPMALNLHADDRISLRIVPLRPRSPSDPLRPEDVPLGRAVCLLPDSIDQREAFVLHHLWDGRLSFRLRLPRGRVFPVCSQPLVDVEAVPITKGHAFTKISLALEEISIVARPMIAGAARQSSMPATRSSSSLPQRNGHDRDQDQSQSQSQSQGLNPPTRRPSAAGSVASHISSSSDDVAVKPSHNAWAYAQECSSEYQNARTQVKELSRVHFSWPASQQGASIQALHGIIAAKMSMRVPFAGEKSLHTDTRNSHIQIHHQIVYELEYQQKPDSSEPATDYVSGLPASVDTRIKAVAHVYKSLGKANIVRREELPVSQPTGVHTVRGTLPVAIVPKRISDLWGIRNLSQDTLSEPSAVVAALEGSGTPMEKLDLYLPPVSGLPLPTAASASTSASFAPDTPDMPAHKAHSYFSEAPLSSSLSPLLTLPSPADSSSLPRNASSAQGSGEASSGAPNQQPLDIATADNTAAQRLSPPLPRTQSTLAGQAGAGNTHSHGNDNSNKNGNGNGNGTAPYVSIPAFPPTTPIPAMPEISTNILGHGGIGYSAASGDGTTTASSHPSSISPSASQSVPTSSGFGAIDMSQQQQQQQLLQQHTAYPLPPISPLDQLTIPYPPVLSAIASGSAQSPVTPIPSAPPALQSIASTADSAGAISPYNPAMSALSGGDAQLPYGDMAYTQMFQEQLRIFQEQQRIQQEQFMRHLAEQYANMMSPGRQHTYPPTLQTGPPASPQSSAPPTHMTDLHAIVTTPPGMAPPVSMHSAPVVSASVSHQYLTHTVRSEELGTLDTLTSVRRSGSMQPTLASTLSPTAEAADTAADAVSGVDPEPRSMALLSNGSGSSGGDRVLVRSSARNGSEFVDPVPPCNTSANTSTSTSTRTTTHLVHGEHASIAVASEETTSATAPAPDSMLGVLSTGVAPAIAVAFTVSTSSSSVAAPGSNAGDDALNSPPPNYDDLLPPEYEVPATQPPPYRAVENNPTRRRRLQHMTISE